MPENHQDPLTRYYSNHPDHLARAHRALLGGIAEEAHSFLGEHPELAHHAEIENIRNSPKSEHLQRLKALHEKESRGPEPDPDSNEAVDAHLKEHSNAYAKLAAHFGGRPSLRR